MQDSAGYNARHFRPLPQEKVYTINDIYTLPDGERAEIIDGQIYYMDPPNTKHQRISGMLHTKINNYIGSRRGRCEVFAAPFAVFLNQDDKNYVEPDISVVCVPDKLDERGCNGAPDWIIEICFPKQQTNMLLIRRYQQEYMKISLLR